MFVFRVCVCLGAAQLINKLNGEDFNEADEQLFEVSLCMYGHVCSELH